MNLLELAKQADVAIQVHEGQVGGPWKTYHVITPDLERFAALVRAEALDEAAGVCDEAVMFHEAAAGSELAGELAAAIRALAKEKT